MVLFLQFLFKLGNALGQAAEFLSDGVGDMDLIQILYPLPVLADDLGGDTHRRGMGREYNGKIKDGGRDKKGRGAQEKSATTTGTGI